MKKIHQLPCFVVLFVAACGSVSPMGEAARTFADALYRHREVPITLRVGYVPGSAPHKELLDGENPWTVPIINLKALFPGRSYVVPVVESEMYVLSGAAQAVYTDEDINRLANQIPGTSSDLRMVFIPGLYDQGNGPVFLPGVTLPSGDVIAIFKRSSNLGTAFDDTAFEQYVITHEVGHAIGLVNGINGEAPMVVPHEDQKHPGHDINAECVMYWTVGANLDIWRASLAKNGGLLFDQSCRDDVAVAIGRGTKQ